MTLVCAHRGASAHAPENTMAALRLAAEHGARMAEIDVQLSADGVPVVIHDATVDRTTSGSGQVGALTLDALQSLDAGSWFGAPFAGERIPTLSRVLAEMASRLLLNIELKGTQGPELEKAAVKVILEHDCRDRCLLTSFDRQRIDRIRQDHPHFRAGYIVGRGGWRADMLGCGVPVLSLEQSLVNGDLVKAARAQGQEIHVWTVDEERDLKRHLGLGVDVIITNQPERLRTLLCSR